MQIEKTRVTDLCRSGSGWSFRTLEGELSAEYCVVATGARNALRDVGTEWSAANKMVAMGYYIPVDRDHIDIEFIPGYAGYIWIFPRNGHLSAGICAKGVPSQALRRRLEDYLAQNDIPLKDATLLRPRNSFAGEAGMAIESRRRTWLDGRWRCCWIG